MQETTPVLTASGVTKSFAAGGGRRIRAVDGIDLALGRGEIVAVVGESGSGKSTLARLLLRLIDPDSGAVLFDGRPLGRLRRRADVLHYRRRVQMVFQDPFSAFNPVWTVGQSIVRAVRLHHPGWDRARCRQHALQMVREVGLGPAEEVLARYPHEFSGGQRQRLVIARALAVEPDVLVADEPTSMLDVSIGIDVLNLLLELRRRRGIAVLYITHNLASARYLADRVLVMYGGRVVEEGPVETVVQQPRHPYTRMLVAAAPEPDAGRLAPADGGPSALAGSDARLARVGCIFAARCPLATERCRTEAPAFHAPGDGARVRCHLWEDGAGP